MGRALKPVLAALGSAVFVLGAISPCESGENGTYFSEQCRQKLRDMNDARSVLESKPQADWTDQEAEAYLMYALGSIHSALVQFLLESGRHPADTSELIGSGLISSTDWPGNPFDDWKAITWSMDTNAFSAGNLVLQLCPPHMYTGVKVAPRPMTFTLGIYGPSSEYKPINPPSPLFDWDQEPNGVAFITGTRFSTSDEQRKKLEAQERRRQEAEKAEADKQQ